MEGLVPLLPLLGILLVFWLLVIRPASRRQREMRTMQAALAVGDRVMTTSGFYGTLLVLHDDRAEIELAPGTTVTIARAAIAGPDPASASSEPEPDTESGPRLDKTPEES